MSERGDGEATPEGRLETPSNPAELLELTHDVMIVRDLEGRISFWNRAAEHTYGWGRDEAIGQVSHLLLRTEFPQPVEEINALLARDGQWDGRLVQHTRHGRRLVVASRWSLRRGAPGRPDEVLEINIDVTAEDAAERAVTEARDEAERAKRAKSEFLSRMSHELRTPLNAILGFTQLMQMGELSAHQHDDVDQVVRAGRHLLELVDEVLDLAGIEAGRIRLSLEPVRLADAVSEALRMLDPLAAAQRVALHDHVREEADLHVRADRHRLKQVLLNLVSNAVKYNRDEGEVHVRARATGDGQVRLVVEDTGIGIAEHDLDRLFDPFERLGPTYPPVEGTGLGLALTKGLVEAMGGGIGASSVVGRGSAMWVDLAVADPPEESPAPAAGEDVRGEHGAGAPRTVLYVADNLANVKLVERVLSRRPDVELLVAMQASVGLDLALQHRPALVLLDLDLPDMPGQEVLRRLRADLRTAGIPVVVSSAEASTGQVKRLRASGAAGHLTRPFDVAALLAFVDGLADAASSSDEETGPAVTTAAPLDPVIVAEIRDLAPAAGDGGQELEDLVATFLESAHAGLDGLCAAVGDGDVAAVRELAHRLGGSSATLGARVVAELCLTIEERASAGELSGVAELASSLRRALADAERALRTEFSGTEAIGGPHLLKDGAGTDAAGARPSASVPAGVTGEDARARVRSLLERPDALEMVFQPIVDIFDGHVTGVEALARIHAEPASTPDVWFRDAARVGLGTELELLALHRAMEQVDDVPGEHLSVNLSAETLVAPAFARFVERLGDQAGRLVVELTEHTEVVSYGELLAALGPVRAAGVRLAVDDAGAGYSSFQHILRLGPEFIKIDRSIVTDIDVDPARRALATAVADFAGEIEALVIAEGVERLEELGALRTTGVRLVQGYLTGRPSPLPIEVAELGLERATGRALVVDDDPVVRLLVSRVLRRNGLDVVGEAADGREGITLAEALQPDVIVLDLQMPALDGVRALPRLRGSLPEARIIVLSVHTVQPEASELRALGAHAVIDKKAVASQLPEVLAALR